MFKNPFSFEGRIRRKEYGLTILIYYVAIMAISSLTLLGESAMYFMAIPFMPLIWFMIAQGAKRCHDRGNSGWYQLIPFYGFWMLFAEGDAVSNEYGVSPKEIVSSEVPIDMVA